MKSVSLLKLLHLSSPALPVGAYAYSQAQEYAVDDNWITSEEKVVDWIGGVLLNSISSLDLPCLIRMYHAWQKDDIKQVKYWNDYLLACRETSELLLEDEQLGQALQRLLLAVEKKSEIISSIQTPSFVAMFSYAGSQWEIPIKEVVLGFSWSWVENQVAAATKLLPLGQTQAQRCLVALMTLVEEATNLAEMIYDDDIGPGLPGLSLASSLHERQYSRLFRS